MNKHMELCYVIPCIPWPGSHLFPEGSIRKEGISRTRMDYATNHSILV